MDVTPDAWRLFYHTFKEDEEVVVVCDNDEFLWGRLHSIKADGCVVRRYTGARGYYDKWNYEDYFVPWDEIRFMAHDGFPVRKLMGADGSKSIEQLDTTDIQKAIRQSLWTPTHNNLETIKREEKVAEDEEYWKTHPYPYSGDDDGEAPHSAVFGDPFFIEGVSMELLNKGNGGHEGWDDHLFEEVLVCQAKDGAMGLLYDLTTVYHFS